MFIGRWQLWHNEDRWLIDQALDKGKKVLLCIRDVPTDEKNPFTPHQVMLNLFNELQDIFEEGKLRIIIIPDIESINIDESVEYDIIEYKQS